MGRAGILTEEDRVELVEGVLYRKPMKKGTHSIAARETAAALLEPFRPSPISSPARILCIPSRAGMPEPDVSVVRGKSRDYSEQPAASDVALSSRSARKALHLTGPRSSECTPAAAFRSTGSSTSSTARLKSTRPRARRLSLQRGLHAWAECTDRDRRRAGRACRRGRVFHKMARPGDDEDRQGERCHGVSSSRSGDPPSL